MNTNARERKGKKEKRKKGIDVGDGLRPVFFVFLGVLRGRRNLIDQRTTKTQRHKEKETIFFPIRVNSCAFVVKNLMGGITH